MNNNEKLLTTNELSTMLGLSVSTLLLYRAMGIGPDYIKIRRAVRYRPSKVNEWLEAQNK